jgi:hypothetical protein
LKYCWIYQAERLVAHPKTQYKKIKSLNMILWLKALMELNGAVVYLLVRINLDTYLFFLELAKLLLEADAGLSGENVT